MFNKTAKKNSTEKKMSVIFYLTKEGKPLLADFETNTPFPSPTTGS